MLTGEAARLLAPERDLDGLAERLAWLVDHPEQWAQVTGAARERVEKAFSAKLQGERLAAIYAELARAR